MSPQPVMAEASGLTEEEEAEVRTHNVKMNVGVRYNHLLVSYSPSTLLPLLS